MRAGALAGLRRRRLAQQSDRAARGQRHLGHEGGHQRPAEPQHARRLVGRGLRRHQRLGHSRPRRRRINERRDALDADAMHAIRSRKRSCRCITRDGARATRREWVRALPACHDDGDPAVQHAAHGLRLRVGACTAAPPPATRALRPTATPAHARSRAGSSGCARHGPAWRCAHCPRRRANCSVTARLRQRVAVALNGLEARGCRGGIPCAPHAAARCACNGRRSLPTARDAGGQTCGGRGCKPTGEVDSDGAHGLRARCGAADFRASSRSEFRVRPEHELQGHPLEMGLIKRAIAIARPRPAAEITPASGGSADLRLRVAAPCQRRRRACSPGPLPRLLPP